MTDSEQPSNRPADKPSSDATESRAIPGAVLRGFRQKCPNCGLASLYYRYLKVNANCPTCKEALHHQRADDAPPYITIVIVGHIVLPLVLLVERHWAPATITHLLLWLPLTLGLTLFFLPRVKGALVGLQWGARMHGFGDQKRTTP